MLRAGTARRVVRVIAWVLFGFAALGVAAYEDAALYSLTVAFAAFAPYLMLAGVPAGLAFLVARHWLGAVLSLLVVVLAVATTVPLYVGTDRPSDSREVRVLTVNARLGRADPASIVAAVRRDRPDFLMVEELTVQLRDALTAAGVDRALPHRETKPFRDGVGTGLWSRYPLQVKSSLRITLRSVVVRAAVPGVSPAPTVVALHVAGPFPAAADWVRDYARLPSRLRELPGPVIAAGDFNATHSISPFRGLLDDGYADAGDQAGAGLLRTYPANNPVIGIDHVLVRGGTATMVRTVRIAGTDHLGLLATVALPRRS